MSIDKSPDDNTDTTCPRCGHKFDSTAITTNPEMRWRWTGTILAVLIVTSLPAFVTLFGFGIISLGAIGQGWAALYATIVLMAATWVWGKETLQSVREARSD